MVLEQSSKPMVCFDRATILRKVLVRGDLAGELAAKLFERHGSQSRSQGVGVT
jgi:hypothetical protein